MFLSLKATLLGSIAVVGTAVPATIITKSSFDSSTDSVVLEKAEITLPEEKSEVSSQQTEISKEITEDVSATSPSTSLAKKLEERHNNPTLCREIVKSIKDSSWIRACRESFRSSKVEFEYYSNSHSMPISVENLRFTSSELVINLSKENELGSKHVRFNLTPEMITLKGSVFTSAVGGKSFSEKQCKIEESLSGDEK